MEFPKVVLGLKANRRPSNTFDDSSDDGNFFSSSSDDQNLFLTRTTPIFSKTTQDPKQKVVEFTDVSSRITPLCSALKDFKIPEKNFANIYLIPENVLPESVLTEIDDFINDRKDDLELSNSAFDDVFVAQFEILKWHKEIGSELFQYINLDIDPRILSLLHFCIAKQSINQHVSLFHYLSSIEEAVKSPTYAPIAGLFLDYGVTQMIKKVADLLVDLFPKHPILPSVLHSLAEFNKDIPEMIEKLEKDQESANIDDSDDSDDSFFEFLRTHKNKCTTLTQVHMVIEDRIVNPLDFSILTTKPETLAVSVNGPPNTMTYFLNKQDEKISFSAAQFSDWILSMRNIFNQSAAPSNDIKQTIKSEKDDLKNVFISLPCTVTAKPDIHSDNSNSHTNEADDSAFYLDLYNYLTNHKKLLSMLPNEISPDYFHLYYPILQIINSTSTSACIKKGCPYPELIGIEKDGHTALLEINSDIITPLRSLLEYVPKTKEKGVITHLAKKRPLPKADMRFSEDIVAALAAADVEFIIEGRSPLTAARVSSPPTTNLLDHPILSRNVRAYYLYNIYSTKELPPYYAFRIGFAAALTLMEVDANISCSIMLELVYMMHSKLPLLTKTPLVRNAVLFFAETLERSDRYYHACLVIDNYFLSNVKESSAAASDIAQIAQRNGDTVRAIFFYTESIKKFVLEGRYDESLYLGQIVAQIYVDNGLLHLALSILSYLLKNTYPIQVYEPKKLNAQKPMRLGTLRVARQTIALDTPNFIPSSQSINTMLVCCSYIDILIRCKMYKTASETLQILENSMETPVLQSITSYLRSRILVRSNRYDVAIKTLPNFTIKNQQRTATHISLLSGTSFDSSTAILRMMAKATINMKMYRECIVWSEIIIQSKSSLREVGAGFLWRGMSYYQALTSSHLISDKTDFRTTLSEQTRRFVHYKPEVREYTERDITIEAVSSLALARICFERVGAIKKETQASLMYVDTILHYFYDPSDQMRDREKIMVAEPILETVMNMPTQKQENIKTPVHDITFDSCAEEMSRILNFAEKNASRIMCPDIITYTHALQAKLNLMKDNIPRAKTYFDFAFSTVKKYTSGSKFAIKFVSSSILRSFEHTIELLCDLIVGFESSYINDHLIIFDILSDVRVFINNKHRTVTDGTNKLVVSDIDMDGEALALNNPKLPSFLPALKLSGYIKGPENEIESRNQSFDIQFRLINSNIRLFETGKLSEELMHMRNKQCCHQIEKLAVLSQNNYRNSVILDTKYTSIQKHSDAIQRTILVQRILHGIFVFVPSTGQKNIFKFKPHEPIVKVEKRGKNKGKETRQTYKTIDFKTDDKHFQIPVALGEIPTSFYRAMLEFILVDKKVEKEHFSSVSTTRSVLDKIKKEIFGDLLENCQILKAKYPCVKDKIPELDKKFFGKKGRLATTEPGLLASINFIVSSELRALPLELMFNESLVIRVPSFSTLIEMRHDHPPCIEDVVRCHAFRPVLQRDTLREMGVIRSMELFKYVVWAMGSGEITKEYITSSENCIPYPFALFSSNKSTSYYQNEYQFCTFQDIKSGENPVLPRDIEVAPSLFIFTYADLCGVPLYVEKLLQLAPYSFFMFIPSSSIRKAFAVLNDVFERHKKRIDLQIPQHMDLVKRPEKFIAALQLTLIKELNVPVPIFVPILK